MKPTKSKTKPATTRKSSRTHPGTSNLFLSRESYQIAIQGLRDQGIEQADAVETLKVGLRQANGKPVPAELLA